MNTDIRLKVTFPRHPKIIKLKRHLGTWEPIINLWLWAAENRPDGNLSGLDPEDIAIAADYQEDAKVLIETLVSLKLLDANAYANADATHVSYALHGWSEHNAFAAKADIRSEKARESARIRWNRKLYGCNGSCGKDDKKCHKQCERNANADAKHANSNAPNPYPNPSPSPKKEIPYVEIVSYLNEKTGKNFRADTEETKKLIRARFGKFSLDEFKRVIDNMASKWKDDPKMADFLRPQTLFGTKFESYLNMGTAQNDNNGDIPWL